MIKIIVASTNPVKINSSLNGFKKMFKNEKFIVESISIPSGVSDQPSTNKETYLGALNRANEASQHPQEADYFVGIESGIESMGDEMHTFTWVVIKSKNGQIGKARSASLFLPPKVSKLILEGKELGQADDIVFGMANSKQGIGSVGILTKNVSNRELFYTEVVILSLVPFVNPELYP